MNRPRSHRLSQTGLAALSVGAFAGALLASPRSAEACGCFAPPDPSVPIVQAGERILFSHEDGMVTAHIQIQYAGDAAEFGWLLPLPSVPRLELGIDELFAQLTDATQPKYRLNRQGNDVCGWNRQLAARAGTDAEASPPNADDGVVVVEDSVGPYDYAVLKADTRDEMFRWLVDNGYFIPTGTEDVVGPYVREGAYFLALKLRKGNSAGDIAPVVVRYASDLPMIPLILTSVAANPDMGVQVWVLGEARAIPRNYRHTVINEEHIDWFSAGANYNDVIIKATNEAKDGQSFVTEYAGTSDVMDGRLFSPGRFGAEAELASIGEAASFVAYLRSNGFVWSSPLIAILERTFPMPDAVLAAGVSREQYYDSLDYYLGSYRRSNPELFRGVDLAFDAVATARAIWERIVEPTIAAAELLEGHPKLTRLYTTLSPEEMTRDPVFSFNPELPDVSNVHEATLTYLCTGDEAQQSNTPGVLQLPDGRRFYVSTQEAWTQKDRAQIPYSSRIELLREEGPPEIELDNQARMSASDAGDAQGCGCADAGASASSTGGLAALGLVFGLLVVRRRRPRA
jgi:MYXO-CTERM domain-containing protein